MTSTVMPPLNPAPVEEASEDLISTVWISEIFLEIFSETSLVEVDAAEEEVTDR